MTGVFQLRELSGQAAAFVDFEEEEEAKMKRRKLARLQNLAATLNYQLTPLNQPSPSQVTGQSLLPSMSDPLKN